MSAPPKSNMMIYVGIAVFVLCICVAVGIYFATQGGSPAPDTSSTASTPGPASTSGPAPAPASPKKYTFVGEGKCINKLTATGMCSGVADATAIGLQSNGCWHCLKTEDGTAQDQAAAVATYTGGLFPFTRVHYDYVGNGPCTNDISAARTTCSTQTGTDTIGRQSNGCWHCLKTVTTAGNKNVSDYTNGLYPLAA
jgi:hypothetical protein